MTRFAALALTVLTGFTGLVYEVTWQKYLATLLGSHSEATAAVLAIFLGGLSAGYALFGRATRRWVARASGTGRPLRLLLFYAAVEAGIGVYALLFPALFGIAQALSLLVPGGHAGIGFAFDVALCALLIGPPSVLMGGTIPILTLALARDLAHATRIHAWVYGFNTLGAFAGALAGAFLLMPILGLDGVLYAMGGLNLVAAALFAWLDRREERAGTSLEPTTPTPVSVSVSGFAGFAAVVLLAGFAMMSLQTVFNRIGSLALGASLFTFAIVVSAFVLSIALGSLAVSALPRISSGLIVGSQWLLVLLLVLAYGLVPDVPYYAHVLRTSFRQVDGAFYPYYYVVFSAAFAVLVVPIALSGALLPLLFHHLRREIGDLGGVAGRLYSWNTVGSLLGALLGGYVLLFWLDLHHVFRIALAAVIVGTAILTIQLFRLPRVLTSVLVVVPSLVGLWMMPAWSSERLDAGLFRKREPGPLTYRGADALFARKRPKIVFHRDGPNSTATVKEGQLDPEKLNLSLATNGKTDGHLVADYPTMALCGLLPALLTETPTRSFVIGYGTGVSAGELAALEQTSEIHVAEISQAVLEAAPLFEEGNLAPLASPKVVIHRGDAFRTLLRDESRYDLIVSEPSNPWVTGVEMLYSLEFLEAARSRLTPGGVYAQWFHLYEIDNESVELVLRTYAQAFPHVSVWFTMNTDLLLLGFNRTERALDVGALEARFNRRDFSAGFERVGITSFAALLAHELLPLGTVHAGLLPGELHTLRHPRLSYLAARAFFRGHLADLPKFVTPAGVLSGARNSLLRRYAGGRAGSLPEPMLDAAARETCRLDRTPECATLLALWMREHPESSGLKAALESLRGGDPAARSVLQDEYLRDLGAYFDAKRPNVPEGTPLSQANHVTRQFVRHFYHAAPFDRRALGTTWAQCETKPCNAARRRLEERIGRLGGRRGGGAPAVRGRRNPPHG